MLQALEETPLTPASSLPQFGTFWSAQHAEDSLFGWPPFPGNDLGLDAWSMGDGHFLLNDTNVDYAELAAEAELSAPAFSMMSMMLSSLGTSFAYGNPVYLTNLTASFATNGTITASFGIAGGTNFVPYDILVSTNVAAPVASWNWLGIGYTSNSYTFSNQPVGQAFYILAKPVKTMVVGYGNDAVGQCDLPVGITNALMVAGGGGQSLALMNDGTVAAWGQNGYGEGSVPTNVVGVTMVTCGWFPMLPSLPMAP
jgi:hypothetical protein